MQQRKRFIAGAVCPQCQRQDTLAVWREAETEVVACVKCSYRQHQSDAPAEPRTDNIIGMFHPD